MSKSNEFTILLTFILTVIILEGDSIKVKIKDDKKSVPRDYRPSKWLSNSAMDVWYGNKSMVDILSREFNDVMYRIAMRPVRFAEGVPVLSLVNATLPSIDEQMKHILQGRRNDTLNKIFLNHM